MHSSLSTELLLAAYSHGFFPMPHPKTEEIIWFNPDPRAILPLDGFHCSRSLHRSLRKSEFTVSINRDFVGVMAGCAAREETWINAEISTAYQNLHEAGHAHSLEIWQKDDLVGGTYGVVIGGAFFAESKFHKVTDASKAALYYLTEHLRAKGFSLLEVQFMTPHLRTLGVIEIPVRDYEQRLGQALRHSVSFEPLVLPTPHSEMESEKAPNPVTKSQKT
jgi:leucyl/phenylalanyl-tRNA--protein transferase